MKRIWLLLILISAIIIVDQITKGVIQTNFHYGESVTVIEGFFDITHVRNTGAAFGMGANANILLRKFLFLVVPVFACLWLCWLIWVTRTKAFHHGLAYSLILAGAIGNLIDRFSYGYVVDFLDFYFNNSHFPAFNVADSSITIAAGILIFDFLVELKKEKRQGRINDASSSKN